MKKWLKRALRPRTPHPTLINVFLSQKAVTHNLQIFRGLAAGASVAPVLKSNAYGHGLVPVAEIVSKEKVPFIIVDSYFEARTLRNEGIDTPLLIIGYSLPEDIFGNRLKNIAFTITSLSSLKDIAEKAKGKALRKAKRNISLHIKIDTGMHRQGILIQEKEEATKIVRGNPYLILEGISSHLAESGNTDTKFTEQQIAQWNSCVTYFRQEFPALKYWHLANTDGHFHAHIQANVTRLGIGLYGIHGPKELIPVMRIETIVTSLRMIAAGESVGYDRTFTADSEMKVATIPFGYYEGFDRRLSNKGCVEIAGVYCPIVGRVSMNITSVDVSEIEDVKIGDKVTVISDVRADKNSFEEIAKACDTISYEMVVRISPLLKRVVV